MASPDIATLLRRQQILQGMNQGTQPTSVMPNPGISQFNTPSTGTASGQPQRTSPGILSQAAVGAAASGGNIADAVKNAAENTAMGQGIQGLGNVINPPQPTPAPQAQPAPINNVPQQAPPPQQPQLIKRGPEDPTAPNATGFHLQLGPNGQVMAVPITGQ